MDGRRNNRRPSGTPNEVTKIMREKLTKAGVADFLLDCMEGRIEVEDVIVGMTKDGDTVNTPIKRKPTYQERLDVAKHLLKKVMPDMKAVEITGEDGGPISFYRVINETEKE